MCCRYGSGDGRYLRAGITADHGTQYHKHPAHVCNDFQERIRFPFYFSVIRRLLHYVGYQKRSVLQRGWYGVLLSECRKKRRCSHPVKQGLVQQMLSVFIDTLLICSATAFMCLSTSIDPVKYAVDGSADAAGYVQASMGDALGSFGPIFLAVAMSLFAFTTLIGNYSYCEGCLEFIIRRVPSRGELLVFRIIATVVVYIGAVASAAFV